MLWTAAPYDSIPRVWGFALFLGAFVIGSGLNKDDFKGCMYFAFAGLVVNAGFSIVDFIDPNIILTNDQYTKGDVKSLKGLTAGLQTNPNYLGQLGILIGLGLIAMKGKWDKIMGALALGFGFIPLAKSAIVAALVIGGVYAFKKIKNKIIALMLVAIVGSALLGGAIYRNPPFQDRPALYLNSVTLLSAFGTGAGSFWAVWPKAAYAIIESGESFYRSGKRPRTAHNDVLTISIETGMVGGGIYLLFLISIYSTARNRESVRPALVLFSGFLIIGLFSFPMFIPAQMFLAAVSAGRMVNDT